MIPLTRNRNSTAVHASFQAAGRLLMAEALFPDADGKRTFDAGKWKKAKNQLKKESFKKCAYCEAPTAVVAHGDVEHYRPKSVYWWLAYCYDNYLYACQICNQTYKGDNFPLSGAQMPGPAVPPGVDAKGLAQIVCSFTPDPCGPPPALDAYLNAHAIERALLLNPYLDSPDTHYAWEVDDVLKEVTLVPANAAAKPYVEAAEKFYGLNREELRRIRFDWYENLADLYEILKEVNPDSKPYATAIKGMKRLIKDEEPFAGMSRYFVKSVWKVLP